MTLLFKRMILLALTAALGVAAMPFVSVSAAGLMDPSPREQISNEKLERIWARQLRAYQRMGHTDQFMDKVQQLIDRASAGGRDVSAVQAALNAFAARVKEAHPLYESARGIINAHQGFDSLGNVTDPEKATETVKEMGEKLKEIRESMNGTGRALKEAIKAFRDANPRPEKTSVP